MEFPESCDTFVVLPSHTKWGYTIFGKNSDRPGEEVQEVEYVPAKDHSEKSLQCTYIAIPQVPRTHAIALSKPAWMWGAEMGANEHGVTIGNEAVWTKLNGPEDSEEKLLGMDLLRLGLERGKTAAESLDVITGLLETHGQGGPCSEDNPDLTYHNSFLIADSKEAWVLETAGKEWAAEQIQSGYRNISNNLTIQTKIDRESAGLRKVATEKGWWDGKGDFNFAVIYSESGEACGTARQKAGEKLLKEKTSSKKFMATDMMSILRNENSGICMKKDGFGSASTGSQVSLIPPSGAAVLPIHFFTGTPDPSLSAFKPFIFAGPETVGSRYLISPKYEDKNDPAKQKPRFGSKVDRKHPLYAVQERALAGKHPRKTPTEILSGIQTMEENCLNDIDARIEAGQSLEDAGSLFRDCCESEYIIYKH